MDFDLYQKQSARTLASQPKYMTREERLVLALGLAGEAGETIDYVKKIEGHGHPLVANALSSELGDVLWYVAALASAYGLNLGDVAAMNVAKLRARYPDGFSSEASINRVEK